MKMTKDLKEFDNKEDELYNKFYPITSICKADILFALDIADEEDENLTQEQKNIVERVAKISDSDMKWIASKMADAYCSDGYWIDLKIITKQLLTNEK